MTSENKIAVLIPCYNEDVAIKQVVRDFNRALPDAAIYVYDNNSTDDTAEIAKDAGATVCFEPLQGKGNVVRRMFSDIEADIYVLVDGDATYEAAAAPKMIDILAGQSLDMVTGCRITNIEKAYRPGHRQGNKLLTGIVAAIFGNRAKDMLSGYRVMSRRFVKSFPALSHGFEIETELTVHALDLRMPIADIDTQYLDRQQGSTSKLNTIQDGLRILQMIANLVKGEKPLLFFGTLSVVLASISLGLGAIVINEFLQTGLVDKFPTAILAASVGIIATLTLFTGLILDTVTLGRREMKRMAYLAIPAVKRPQ